MTVLNPKTKKARSLIASYLYARREPKSLYDAYANPSEAKRDAWRECQALCREFDGRDLCVVGHNSMAFSAAFTCDHGLVYITKSNVHFVPNERS